MIETCANNDNHATMYVTRNISPGYNDDGEQNTETASSAADAHFASKNTLLERNTSLLKSLTHLAAQNT
jgi:hypothetical protein